MYRYFRAAALRNGVGAAAAEAAAWGLLLGSGAEWDGLREVGVFLVVIAASYTVYIHS